MGNTIHPEKATDMPTHIYRHFHKIMNREPFAINGITTQNCNDENPDYLLGIFSYHTITVMTPSILTFNIIKTILYITATYLQPINYTYT